MVSEVARRHDIEAINGAGGRRRWSANDKACILEESHFMVWLWISAVIVLLGGEINAVKA